MSVSKPHSSYLDAVEDVRVYLTWVPPDHAKGAADALRRLEEQLEAAQQRLAWAARLLRYPDGGDQFSIDCRNWLNDYYATSNPASEPKT